MAKHTGRKKTAGGLSHEPFYQIFNRIRCRCTDPSNKDYPRYGGRGIIFDWPDYPSFKKDMHESYLGHVLIHGGRNTTIERINVNGPYSSRNCRWATFQEQAKNRRTNRYLTYKGRTMILADWARELCVSRQAIRYRVECGWDTDSIIKTPFNYSNKYDKQNKTVRTPKKIHRK